MLRKDATNLDANYKTRRYTNSDPAYPLQPMQTLSPQEFQARIGEPGVQLLDVRTPEEIRIARLDGHVAIALQELPQRVGELDPGRPVAIYCHHGVRSLQAGRFLERQGFADVCHLEGGIDAWSVEIDPRIARY